MRQVREVDWARLAAYIDGEGYIGIKCHKPYKANRENSIRYYALVTIVNTDARLLVWLKETFGVGAISHQEPKAKWVGHRTRYRWDVTYTQAEWLLQGALDYFVIKREQADLCLSIRKTFDYEISAKGRRQHSESAVAARKEIKDRLQLMRAEVHPLPKVS
jgi:hypothetical protein